MNPYLDQNLVSTFIWNDNSYCVFVKTLTYAEKMVLTPLHMQVVILRLRSNNIPFSSHGAICYPLKKPSQAVHLPWYDFNEMPFIVMTYRNKLGTVHEATVDMNKIRIAAEYMNRDMTCPIEDKPRKFYRFCEEIPFSNENLQYLQQALENPDKPSYPKSLRRLDQAQLHKRGDKPIQPPEFQNWLQSGFRIASMLWDSYKLDCVKNEKIATPEDFFNLIKHYAAENENIQKQNANAPTTGNGNVDIDNVTVTTQDIIKFATTQKWLLGITALTDSTIHEGQNDDVTMNITNIHGTLHENLFDCCEELELLSREYSNDEGQDSAVASGALIDIETEHPAYLIQQGAKKSALHRVPFADPNWENPLPEHTPGYFQKAFPFVFLSGDADPYQTRPVSIRQPKSSWEERYMEWIVKQPEAQECPQLQFCIHGRAQRITGRKQVQIAIKNTGINRDDLPTKEELLNDPEKRQNLASKILSMSSEMTDSDAFWRRECQNWIGSLRYFADPPKHRCRLPKEPTKFQTRAMGCNHHPGVHALFPKAEAAKRSSVDNYFKFRLANVLENPTIVQFVGTFMAELDITVINPVIHDSTIHVMRSEWGPNANPHWHSLLWSESLSKSFGDWVDELQDEFNNIAAKWETVELPETDNVGFFINVTDDLIDRFQNTFQQEMEQAGGKDWNARFLIDNLGHKEYKPFHAAVDEVKEKHSNDLNNMWKQFEGRYRQLMEQMYTNWNAGLTKDGTSKTFDYQFDRKVTVAYADVERMIDNSLCTGKFDEIDELYIKVLNGTCRHVGHSGPNDYPSKKDRCAVPKTVVDKQKTAEKVQKWKKQKGRKSKKPKPVHRTVYACKRRKPQPTGMYSAIYQDPHDKKLCQFRTACNDGFLNGGCPFSLPFNLHNVDDKAVVPSWISKKPTIKWQVEGNKLIPKLCLHLDMDGEIVGEYCAKYASKPTQPRTSHGDMMIAAMENLQPENAVTTGIFSRMYNKVSQKGPQPIFQCVHKNLQLPLVIKNFDCRECSVLGISKVVQKTTGSKDNDKEEPMGIEYAMPSLLERFDRRWDTVSHGQNIKKQTSGNKCR